MQVIDLLLWKNRSTPAASTTNKSFIMNDLSDPAKILG
jgi:hypothetical protein